MSKNGDSSVNRASIIDGMMTSVSDISKAEASRVFDSIIKGITDGLLRDQEVKISGFGKFILQNKRSRIGRNPKTGEPVTINARRVLKFRTSDILREQLNEGLVARTDSPPPNGQ